MSTTRLFFARAILAYGRYQRGAEYEQALVAVMTGENSQAHWNGLDTTLFLPGATAYNTFGANGNEHVWNYADALDGVHATVATINQSNMKPFWTALRDINQSAYTICRAFAATPWGYVGDDLPAQLVQEWNDKKRNYVTDRDQPVAGPGDWPFKANGDQNP